jgi:UDP-N-acetylglucosamine 2-epimerase (non-hydrolysing)
MKVAPVLRALGSRKISFRLIHTGQHFDPSMSDVFFRDLGMPAPDATLHVGSGSHATQTAAVLLGMETELRRARPRLLVVVGDVTSTLAAALAAAKLGIPVAHVEAGLRSRDWTMPEEINRILTDQLSDLLLIPSEDARANLVAEGIAPERIAFVGNVMIDSLHHALAQSTDVLQRFQLTDRRYAVATMHRPANVDDDASLTASMGILAAVSQRLPVVFPVHPRTRSRLAASEMSERWKEARGLRLVDPLGYIDFSALVKHATLALTDSGGIQEETTALGIPCLTLRATTERPITVTEGTNVVVGLDRERILTELERILSGHPKRGTVPRGWDGQAAATIAACVERFLAGNPPPKTAARPASTS